MPVGSVNNDHYGVDRPGANLFGNSLVAVDVKTGKLKWYFQAIHHDLWDYDMPAAPMLFDVVQHGKKIPAVAVITKNPLLFILNRETGKPIYGVEERPVPEGDAPGEWYSPTQPFPLKPPPLSRLSFTENDFAHITPAHEAACREWYAKFLAARRSAQQRPLYAFFSEGNSPISRSLGRSLDVGRSLRSHARLLHHQHHGLRRPALHSKRAQPKPAPSYADPDHQSPILYSTQPGSAQSAISFAAYSFSADGWPCWAPPWGRLTAVDVNTGDIAWQIPYGTMSGIPAGIKTGAPSSRGGPTATAGGLVFMTGSLDQYFRALETKTGKELWSFKLDQAALAVPIVYAGKSGKEYVAVAAGEHLVAFALGGQAAFPSMLQAQTQLPDGKGRELVQRVCNSCHSVDLITTHRQTRDEWTGTVQRMAQHGASATDEQFQQIVDYLTDRFGRSPDPKE